MRDGKKIIPCLLIFLTVTAYPFLHNSVSEKTGYVALKPELPKDEKECVEPKEVIRINHKDLLDQWKTSVVRNGVRIYEAKNKRRYLISLNCTCMRCHADKTKFCDRCHEYMAVTNNKCWDCHMSPKQVTRE